MSNKKIQCPTCMETIDAEFTVCPFCGENLSNISAPVLPSATVPPVAPPPVYPTADVPEPPAAPVVPPAPQPTPYAAPQQYDYVDDGYDETPAGFYHTFVGREFFGRYAQFGGTTGRANYWFTVLAMLILEMGLYGLTCFFLGSVTGFGIVSTIFTIVGLATVIPSIAIVVRRLRDSGKSPWLILLGLIPIVGPIILLVFFCQSGVTPRRRFSFKAPDWIITILCVVLFFAGIGYAASKINDVENGLDRYDMPRVDDYSDDYYGDDDDDVVVEEAIEEVVAAEEPALEGASGTYTLTGTVAGAKVIVEMMVNGGTVTGRLRYAKINPPSWLDINGYFSDGYYFMFQESNDDGMMTGEYSCEGKFDSRGRLTALRGEMTNYKGKTYTVNLTVQ